MCGRAETATEQSESTVGSPNSPWQPDAELGRCHQGGGLMVMEGLVEELIGEVVWSASSELMAVRCVNCGNIVDPVILNNQRRATSPRSYRSPAFGG